MKSRNKKPDAAVACKENFFIMSRNTISRREFLAISAAVGVTMPGANFWPSRQQSA
jgi:hypothetical protein